LRHAPAAPFAQLAIGTGAMAGHIEQMRRAERHVARRSEKFTGSPSNRMVKAAFTYLIGRSSQ
jgi:hypothetical protein